MVEEARQRSEAPKRDVNVSMQPSVEGLGAKQSGDRVLILRFEVENTEETTPNGESA